MLVDFTNCPNGYRDYGGTDTKRSIEYNGRKYMLKIPEIHKDDIDFKTPFVNSVFSEYIGSHIIASLGLPVQETILGLYQGEPAVACKDFAENGYRLQEFAWMMKCVYRSSEIGRIPTYTQLYDVMDRNALLRPIRREAIERYWEMFWADALIGNSKRYISDWGYLVNEDSKDVKLAPIYDCAFSLYPDLSEDDMISILNDDQTLEEYMHYPKAALDILSDTRGKKRITYHGLLATMLDKHCMEAFMRIYRRINMKEIDRIVNTVPLISSTRIDFYKAIIHHRKELIFDKVYEMIAENLRTRR